MKYLKMLSLAAIAAAALGAFAGAGTASATTLTGAGGVTLGAGTVIEGLSEGKVILETAVGKIECDSATQINVENEGGAGVQIVGNVGALNWFNCGTSFVQVRTKGEVTITGAGGNNGNLVSTGFELTVEKGGFHCIFTTTNTKVGTVTGSATTGATATIDLSGTIPRTGGKSGAFCGATGTWKGSYKINLPDTLNIDV